MRTQQLEQLDELQPMWKGQLIRCCFLDNAKARAAMFRAGLAVVGEDATREALVALRTVDHREPVGHPVQPAIVAADRQVQRWLQDHELLVRQAELLTPPPPTDADLVVFCAPDGELHAGTSSAAAWRATIASVLRRFALGDRSPCITDLEAELDRFSVLHFFTDADPDVLEHVFGAIARD